MIDDQRDGWHPVSFSQQGMWLNEQRLDGGGIYHMPFTLTFDGPLDRAALLTALAGVLRRQPVLGSAFEARDEAPYTGPAASAPEVVPVDLSTTPDADAALAEAVRAEIVRPFDLRQGPLLRLTLFAVHPTRHVLLVVAHHLVFDGESMEIFGRQLADGYRAAVDGGPEPVADDPDFFAAYVADERRRVAEALPAAREYWQGRWRPASPPRLPGLGGTVPDAGPGEAVELHLTDELTARLDRAAEKTGVTRFEFLLASLYGLLSGYGDETPTVTLALGLRTAALADRIGPFAQEVPVPVPVAPDATVREFATGLRASLRELYRFREVPVNQAVPGIPPSAMHTPVALSYRAHSTALSFPGLQVTAEWLFNFAVRGALWIQVLDRGHDLRVVLRYPAQGLAAAGADRIARDWLETVEAAAADPDQQLSAVVPARDGHLDQQVAPTHDGHLDRSTPEGQPATTGTAGRPTPGRPEVDEGVVAEVTTIWQEVLRVKKVGPHANLFDFGVNSLTVTQIAARVKQRLKVDIPMEEFYETPTITGIAALIGQLRTERGR